MKKLAIVVSHPIQYYAPLFSKLAEQIELKVFYCHRPTPTEIGKDGFGKAFTWDINLLSGYAYEFLENVSKEPSVTIKNGCDTPEVGNRILAYGATHVVVFGWYLKSHLQVLEFCNKNNIPIAARGDSQLDPAQHWLKRLAKKLYYPFFLSKYDAFLSVGKRNKKYLENFGVSSEKIIFSPHAVDQDFWRVEKKAHDQIVFLWVAKFIPKKRPFDVISAFKMALSNNPSIILNMVGSGEQLQEAKELAKDTPEIVFHGFLNQTELKPIYAQSDVLLITSDYEETWGLVVNEAFASEIPVIVSSAVGCSADMVKQNTGQTYPLGDIEGLTNSILKYGSLMKEQNEVNQITKAIKEVNAVYSFNRNIQSFQEFLNYN